METFVKRALWLAIGLNLLSIILSGYAWAQTSKLSLPFPKGVSIMSLVFPIIASALVPLVARYFQTRRYGFFLPHVSAHLFTMLPLVLIVLSFVFGVPTPLLTCSLESRWQHLFRIKDDRAIRAIQDTLRCCGLNSIRDRAWPFPSNGVDARACETTQGWNIRCLDPWRRQEATAAGMVGLANLSTWTLVILLAYVTHVRQEGLQLPRFGMLGGNQHTRLLGGLESGDGEIHEESGHRHGQAYSDVAEGEDGPAQEERS